MLSIVELFYSSAIAQQQKYRWKQFISECTNFCSMISTTANTVCVLFQIHLQAWNNTEAVKKILANHNKVFPAYWLLALVASEHLHHHHHRLWHLWKVLPDTWSMVMWLMTLNTGELETKWCETVNWNHLYADREEIQTIQRLLVVQYWTV